jgi:anti-anti-sigma factor
VQNGFVPVEIHTSVDPDNRVALVRVGGEIDVATAPLLQEALLAQIECRMRTVADLADVTFMDASGVGMLISADRLARQRGVRLTVTHPTGLVARVLRLTRADRILDMDDRQGQPT